MYTGASSIAHVPIIYHLQTYMLASKMTDRVVHLGRGRDDLGALQCNYLHTHTHTHTHIHALMV